MNTSVIKIRCLSSAMLWSRLARLRAYSNAVLVAASEMTEYDNCGSAMDVVEHLTVMGNAWFVQDREPFRELMSCIIVHANARS